MGKHTDYIMTSENHKLVSLCTFSRKPAKAAICLCHLFTASMTYDVFPLHLSHVWLMGLKMDVKIHTVPLCEYRVSNFAVT